MTFRIIAGGSCSSSRSGGSGITVNGNGNTINQIINSGNSWGGGGGGGISINGQSLCLGGGSNHNSCGSGGGFGISINGQPLNLGGGCNSGSGGGTSISINGQPITGGGGCCPPDPCQNGGNNINLDIPGDGSVNIGLPGGTNLSIGSNAGCQSCDPMAQGGFTIEQTQMCGDPSMMGGMGMPMMMPFDPSMMGCDPSMMCGDPSMMGGCDPNAGGGGMDMMQMIMTLLPMIMGDDC